MGKKIFNSSRRINTAEGLTAWNMAVLQGLLDAGFTQTADTGQMTAETAANGASSSSYGYWIFQMADALQTDYPIFVKIELTNYVGSAGGMVLGYISVGKGSDGAGGLVGLLLSRAQLFPSTAPIYFDDQVYAHAAACGDGYMIFQATIDDPRTSSTSTPFLQGGFIIERSRNTDGSLSGAGVLVAIQPAYAGNGSMSLASASAGQMVYAFNYITGSHNLSVAPVIAPYFVNGSPLRNSSSLAAGSIGPVFPWDLMAPGLAPWRSGVVVSVPAGDMPSGVFRTSLSGVAIDFLAIPPSVSQSRWGLAVQAAVSPAYSAWFGAGIRWED